MPCPRARGSAAGVRGAAPGHRPRDHPSNPDFATVSGQTFWSLSVMGSRTPGPTNFILIDDHSWVKLPWFPEGERGGINWETGLTQTQYDI